MLNNSINDYTNTKKSQWDVEWDFYKESENLLSGKYNYQSQIVLLTFKNGQGKPKGSYNYYDVPKDVVDMILQTEGKEQSALCRSEIINAGYVCEKYS